MSKLTKIELVQANAALGAEVQALRVQCAEQAATISMLKAGGAARPAKPVYVPRAPSAEQLALRDTMARAKALAITTGRVVRVGE